MSQTLASLLPESGVWAAVELTPVHTRAQTGHKLVYQTSSTNGT